MLSLNNMTRKTHKNLFELGQSRKKRGIKESVKGKPGQTHSVSSER